MRPVAHILVAAIVLLAWSNLLIAADYYVAPSGDDGNDGLSQATPWLEVQTGLNALHPGDTLHLMPGLHIPSLYRLDPNDPSLPNRLAFVRTGEPDNPIRVTTTGPGAVIDLRYARPGYSGFTTGTGNSNIEIDGGGTPSIWDPSSFHLKICNVPGYGNTTYAFEMSDCNDVTLRNVWLDEAQQTGLRCVRASHCLIENVVVSNDGVNVNSHGVYVYQDNHDLTFRRMRVYGWGKNGVHVTAGYEPLSDIRFEQCVLHDNALAAIFIAAGIDMIVVNSWLYNTGSLSQIDDIVTVQPETESDIQTTFLNCTFYSNTATGRPASFADGAFGASAITSWSNCIFDTAQGFADPDGIGIIAADHNLFAGGIAPIGTAAFVGEPAFADPDAGDLHLTAQSIAIDLADPAEAPTDDIDGLHRDLGGLPDLGADEYIDIINAVLVSSDPPTGSTLAKVANNVVRLVFDAALLLPAGPPVVFEPVAGGPDVAGLFTVQLEPDQRTLTLVENGTALTNQTWYAITPSPELNAEPFTIWLCTLIGDADGNGRVMAADLGVIWYHNGETTAARYDIDGNGRVMAVDLGVAWSHNGQIVP